MRLVISFLIILAVASPSMAGYRETFEREFLSKPWGGEPLGEKSACIECHAADTMNPRLKDIPQKWQLSIHYQNNVSCHDCHGGDPKDPSLAMSHVRGFVGKPKDKDIPEFCGKCHIGIMRNYLESGHGKALKFTGKGPNCVTCHGSHKEDQYIQKAHIDIINERLCSRCHSYERAKVMKQALFLTEKKLGEIRRSLDELRSEGIYTVDEEKALFSTEAEFRALFHTVDVNLVKDRTDEFTQKLNAVENTVQNTIDQLRFRKNYSGFLMLLFAGLGIVMLIFSRNHKE